MCKLGSDKRIVGLPVNEDVGVFTNDIMWSGVKFHSRVSRSLPLHQRIWEEISHSSGQVVAAAIASELLNSNILTGRGSYRDPDRCVGSGWHF